MEPEGFPSWQCVTGAAVHLQQARIARDGVHTCVHSQGSPEMSLRNAGYKGLYRDATLIARLRVQRSVALGPQLDGDAPEAQVGARLGSQ